MRYGILGIALICLTNGLAAQASAEDAPNTALKEFYPPSALAKGLEGEATLRCRMTTNLVMKNCKLISENPKGHGFGAAALSMAAKSQPNPLADVPERNRAPVTYRFSLSPLGISPSPLKPLTVVKNPDWVGLPTAEQVAAAFPTEANATKGRAVIRCVVAVDQTLQQCSVLSEEPANEGFGQAALRLAPSFRLTPKTYDGVPVGGHPVVIPIIFAR